MGKKQSTVTLTQDEKINQSCNTNIGEERTTIWNVLKKKETTGVIGNAHRPMTSIAVDNRNIIQAVKKKNP